MPVCRTASDVLPIRGPPTFDQVFLKVVLRSLKPFDFTVGCAKWSVGSYKYVH
jgi:hypothetical protein